MSHIKREHVFSQPAIAVSIEEAAHMVGISRAQFYRVYLDTGRVVSVRHGRKSRVIDVEELQAAYGKFKQESRAIQE